MPGACLLPAPEQAFLPEEARPHVVDLASVAPISSFAPQQISPALWRASELDRSVRATVPTGFALLDAELPGGGWPTRCLTELLQPQPALCEWRLLAPGLGRLLQEGAYPNHPGHLAQLLLVAPPKQLHAPGLAQLGLPAESILWFAADTPAERLWITEQLVKANPRGAILAWLPQVRAEQLRRLQVHAQSCDCPVFVLRPELAQRDASPAPLRLALSLGIDWQLQVRILKRRGSQHEGVLSLPSIPGLLALALTPQLLRPSALLKRTEATDAMSLNAVSLGSAAAGHPRNPHHPRRQLTHA